MGSFISGTDSWASTDPSLNSTPEWTTDCGCISTSIFETGSEKRFFISMASRPLFISVEESTVILGPMLQRGCLRACAGVTLASDPFTA